MWLSIAVILIFRNQAIQQGRNSFKTRDVLASTCENLLPFYHDAKTTCSHPDNHFCRSLGKSGRGPGSKRIVSVRGPKTGPSVAKLLLMPA